MSTCSDGLARTPVAKRVQADKGLRPARGFEPSAPAIVPSLAAGPARTLEQFGLTRAEHAVLVQLAQGKTNLQIAIELGKQEGTVRIQVSAILRKLGVRGRSEAIVIAMREPSVIDAHLHRVSTRPTDLSWLYPHMVSQRYRRGQVLFREGDHGNEMFVVQQGIVSLPQLHVEMKQGDMFGEIAIFASRHRRTSGAICATEAALFTLGGEKVRQLFYLNPAFAFSMLELIVNRLLADSRWTALVAGKLTQ